jgi:hypothetical protein
MLKRPIRSLVLPVVLVASLAVGTAATAATQEVLSQPNGDFELTLEVGSFTDKDGDGNQDTATKPDKLLIRHQVCRHFRQEQTVDLTITIDRPGAEFDEQLTAVGDLTGTFFCHQQFIFDKVKNQWPSGAYTVTVDAVNEFGDRATATVSIVIN